MKTKHILTALALPAMFAACTADDIVSVDNGLQQDARAKLSKDFVLNTNGEVESRYAVEGNTALNFVYEEGDMIGANLIDVYDPDYKDEPEKWDITPYVAPSLPFKNIGDNQWKSDAELGVGNYLFTYPFNAKDNGRAAAQFELPRVQKYNGEDLNALIEANNKSVGAVVLYEGQTEANVSLKNLYTYPKFVLNFDNGEKINKITKVVLKYTTPVVYKGGFNHAEIVDMFNAETIEEWLEDADNKGKTVADYWAEKSTYDFIIDEADDADAVFGDLKAYGKPETTNYLIVEMGEAVKLESNTSNKYIEIRLMMPSVEKFEDQAYADIVMYAVTDNGTYKVELEPASCLFKGTTSAEAIEQALWRSKSNTLRIDPKAWTKGEDLGNIVTTAEDWNNLVSVYGDSKKYAAVGGTADFKVSVLCDEFALTKDLKMPKVAEFIIETPISVEGNVTLQNVNVNNTVTVKKGATLTTSASFVANTVEVKEGANLVFASKIVDEELVPYTGVTLVENYGNVTVPAGVIANFDLRNYKKASVLNVEAAASRVAAEAGVANLTGINQGTINNNGIINVVDYPGWSSDFDNKAVDEAYGYEQDEDGVWNGFPTINNKGEFNSKAVAVNNGLFINEGTLSSNFISGNTITNNGTVDVKAKAVTFIDENNGTIILAETDPEEFTIFGTAKGTIKYTAGKTPVNLSTSPVNYLIAAGDVTIAKTFINIGADKKAGTADDVVTALPTLEMIAGGKITVTKDDAKLTNLIISAGKCTVANEFTIAKVTIAKNASLTIPEEVKLNISSATISGANSGEGILKVDGTLNFTVAKGDSPLAALNSTVSVGKLGSVTAIAEDKAYEDTNLDYLVKRWYGAMKLGNLEDNSVKAANFTNPYNVEAFANFIKYSLEHTEWVENGYAEELVGEDGWNLLDTDLETIKEKLKSIYSTETTGFVASVDRKIVGEKPTGEDLTDLKELYIDKYGKLIQSVTLVDDLFYTKDMAMRDLATKLADADKSTFDSKKKIYTIISELATALNNTESAKYTYIWAETTCPLYDVAAVAKKYTPNEWDTKWDVDVFEKAEEFDNLKTVQTWVKYADMKGATTEATVAANYVETAPTWEYTAEQVKAAFGAVKVVIEVTAAP